MKRFVLTLLCIAFTTALLLAQDQNTAKFYSGSEMNPDKGLQLANMSEYLILTGISSSNSADAIEVFLKRGTDAVSIKKFNVKNNVFALKMEDAIQEHAAFKSGDELVIKVTDKEIYYIPIN